MSEVGPKEDFRYMYGALMEAAFSKEGSAQSQTGAPVFGLRGWPESAFGKMNRKTWLVNSEYPSTRFDTRSGITIWRLWRNPRRR